MEVGKILPVEAAAILHASPQFVRVAMQQEKLPIGTAIKMSSIWTYNISEAEAGTIADEIIALSGLKTEEKEIKN